MEGPQTQLRKSGITERRWTYRGTNAVRYVTRWCENWHWRGVQFIAGRAEEMAPVWQNCPNGQLRDNGEGLCWWG